MGSACEEVEPGLWNSTASLWGSHIGAAGMRRRERAPTACALPTMSIHIQHSGDHNLTCDQVDHWLALPLQYKPQNLKNNTKICWFHLPYHLLSWHHLLIPVLLPLGGCQVEQAAPPLFCGLRTANLVTKVWKQRWSHFITKVGSNREPGCKDPPLLTALRVPQFELARCQRFVPSISPFLHIWP